MQHGSTHPPDTARCIAIVGMNGVGKSAFGRRLAGKLGRKRIDVDTEFRALHGDIHAFIATHGWEAFRKAEEGIALASLLPGHVVVLGGGAVESPAVRAALKAKATVLWIQAGRKRVHKNLKAAKVTRPEFSDGAGHAKVKALLETRTPLYEEVADIALPPHLRFWEQMPAALKLLKERTDKTNGGFTQP